MDLVGGGIIGVGWVVGLVWGGSVGCVFGLGFFLKKLNIGWWIGWMVVVVGVGEGGMVGVWLF